MRVALVLVLVLAALLVGVRLADEAAPAVEPATPDAPAPAPRVVVEAGETIARDDGQLPAAQPIPEEASGPLVAQVIPIGDPAQIVRDGFAQFGADVAEQAVRVGQCESSLRPSATNAGSIGVMQIHVPSHRARIARLGFTPEQMTEPAANVAVAADLYGEQGWGPWACKWAAR